MAGRLGCRRRLRGAARSFAAEILRARDVPLSLGAHPHGACAQLHDGRRGRALQERARLQRSASPGLGRLRPARRERRDRDGRAARRLDLSQHRRDARADEAAGLLDRLDPGIRDLRSRLLRPAAGPVPRHAGGGPCHPQGGGGELGSGRHDRARQRAGDRRQGLALGRGGRAARADAVVLQDLGLCRRAAGSAGWPDRLARKGAHHAAQLDRQVRRSAAALRAGSRPREGGDQPRFYDRAQELAALPKADRGAATRARAGALAITRA